jgi:hypothetical protein
MFFFLSCGYASGGRTAPASLIMLCHYGLGAVPVYAALSGNAPMHNTSQPLTDTDLGN